MQLGQPAAQHAQVDLLHRSFPTTGQRQQELEIGRVRRDGGLAARALEAQVLTELREQPGLGLGGVVSR